MPVAATLLQTRTLLTRACSAALRTFQVPRTLASKTTCDGAETDESMAARWITASWPGPSECLQIEDVDLEVDPRRRVLVSVENVHRAPVYPGLMIAVTVLSINFVGDGLRDALDARMTL